MACSAEQESSGAADQGPLEGETLCAPGETACSAGWALRCGAQGRAWERLESCGARGLVCERAWGCVPFLQGQPCGEESAAVCDPQSRPWRCGEQGFYEPAAPCAEGSFCVSGAGCLACVPGETRCAGPGLALRCREEGEAFDVVEHCETKVSSCVAGSCVSACGLMAEGTTSAGCEFALTDLEAALDAVVAPETRGAGGGLGVIVGNPSRRQDAIVTVVADEGDGFRPLVQLQVPASSSYAFTLASFAGHGPRYRLWSDWPVIAYQHHDSGPAGLAAATDVAPLRPVGAMGQAHLILPGLEQLPSPDARDQQAWRSFLGVTAVGLSELQLELQLSAPAEGPEGRIWAAGRHQLELSPGAIHTMRAPRSSEEEGSRSLAGTVLQASAPTAVWMGLAASRPGPSGEEGCCDGIQQALAAPLSSWGTRHLAVKAPPVEPGVPFGDQWQLAAGAREVALRYYPGRPEAAPEHLPAHGVAEFESDGALLILADAPVALAHSLQGPAQAPDDDDGAHPCDPVTDARAGGCEARTGALAACVAEPPGEDPPGYCRRLGGRALAAVPPLRRFRREQTFVVPGHVAKSFVHVLAPEAAQIKLNDEALDGFVAHSLDPEGVLWGWYRLALQPGLHSLAATLPVGVLVYGYGVGRAYAFGVEAN